MSYFEDSDNSIIAKMEDEIEDLKRKVREREDACDIKDAEIRRLHRVCQDLSERG